MKDQERQALRRGWTTGACAAAAARSAFAALLCGRFEDPVSIRLPRGEVPSFPLALAEVRARSARAGVVKDAGDDPDVTHGALVIVEAARAEPGSGVRFAAGEGVGVVTRPGLSLAVGEPAINPAPRAMIREALCDFARERGAPAPPDLLITISIPGGERLALRTMNGRLGILGGLSILGTTGVVIPYSCSSWIHSIYRGIDVARAAGEEHLAAATGETSQKAVRLLYNLPEHALIEMGDFAGALLKYLRRHPVRRLTLAGGFAKFAKLAQGHLDLHSARSPLDLGVLRTMLAAEGVAAREPAQSAAQILEFAGEKRARIAERVAAQAREVALATLAGETEVEVAIVDRAGAILARASG